MGKEDDRDLLQWREVLDAQLETFMKQWREALAAHERLDIIRWESSNRSVDKATFSLEKRLDGMNEFRSQLATQARDFMPRKEYEQLHLVLDAKVEAATKSLGGKYDQIASRLDINQGRSSGLNAGWGYLVGLVGLLSTIITLLFFVLSKH